MTSLRGFSGWIAGWLTSIPDSPQQIGGTAIGGGSDVRYEMGKSQAPYSRQDLPGARAHRRDPDGESGLLSVAESSLATAELPSDGTVLSADETAPVSGGASPVVAQRTGSEFGMASD